MYKRIGFLLILSSLFFGYKLWPQFRIYYHEYLFAKSWEQSWSERLTCLSKKPLHADGVVEGCDHGALSEDIDVEAFYGLPKQWGGIRSFTLYPTDWRHIFWLKWIEPPIIINSQGKFHLDVLMMSWEEGGLRFVVLQYDVRELEGHQNTVWEGGQTFRIPHIL